MKRRTLQDLYDLMGPVETAKAKKQARRKMERMLISQMRKQLGLTQKKVAKSMSISQSALSQIEAQDDMQLSTLRRLVRAMGGELDIVARFGKKAIALV